MKKRIGTLIMAGVFACTMALSFAACDRESGEGGNGGNSGGLGGLQGDGGGSSSSSTFQMPEGGFDTSKKVTISFSHTMGQKLRAELRKAVDRFQALYPNITVDNVDAVRDSSKYDELYTMISNQIIADTQPNVAYCYSDHVAGYNTSGAVLTLDDFLPGGKYADMEVTRQDGSTEKLGLTQEQVNKFIPGYYNEGREFADGKMYTMPFSKSTEVLYYNKTFFDNNHLEVPTTWDEMEEVCRKIKTEIDPSCIPLGYDSEANWFITMCEQYGSGYTSATGDHYLFDNQTNRDFVQRFAGWYQSGYVTTQMLNNNTYTSDRFTDQTSYMCIGSTAGASYQQSDEVQGEFTFTVGIAPIPQLKHYKAEDADKADYDANYKPKVISQGPSVCIFKNSDPQQVLASWLLVKYLITDVSFQADFSRVSGYVPVLNLDTMLQDPVFKDNYEAAEEPGNITALSAKVCMEQEDAYFTSPAFVGSAEARANVGTLLQAVFSTPDKLDQIFRQTLEECRQN